MRIRTASERKDQGFTLIELLVVVVIIGILAAIAIPVFLNQRQKAVDSGLKSDLKNAAVSVETWITENPQLAIPTETVLGADAGSGATATATPAALEAFTASPGNTVYLTAGTDVGTYILEAENDSSSEGASQCLTYDSAGGGLDDAWTAC